MGALFKIKENKMSVWMYHKEKGAVLFEDGETIPDDFVDTPAKFEDDVEDEVGEPLEEPKKRGRKPKED